MGSVAVPFERVLAFLKVHFHSLNIEALYWADRLASAVISFVAPGSFPKRKLKF